MYIESENAVINDLVKEIRYLEEKLAEREWVLCSERLPDKGLRVLMQLNNSWQIVGWYDEEEKDWYELMYEEPVANDRVLAWMELPQPYRGDDQ